MELDINKHSSSFSVKLNVMDIQSATLNCSQVIPPPFSKQKEGDLTIDGCNIFLIFCPYTTGTTSTTTTTNVTTTTTTTTTTNTTSTTKPDECKFLEITSCFFKLGKAPIRLSPP